MIGASKILTVSYGTFSCTLEGFDDPFNTMKAIAEYFRDLAAEDRYFGAEPPQPDAAMLHRIAEREIQRRVEARVQDNGVVLRAGEAASLPAAAPVSAAPVTAAPVAADAPASVIPAPQPVAEPVAATVPEPTPALAVAPEPVREAVPEIAPAPVAMAAVVDDEPPPPVAVVPAPQADRPVLLPTMPEGVAAKLARLRQAVTTAPATVTTAPSLGVVVPLIPTVTDEPFEDEHAAALEVSALPEAAFAPEMDDADAGFEDMAPVPDAFRAGEPEALIEAVAAKQAQAEDEAAEDEDGDVLDSLMATLAGGAGTTVAALAAADDGVEDEPAAMPAVAAAEFDDEAWLEDEAAAEFSGTDPIEAVTADPFAEESGVEADESLYAFAEPAAIPVADDLIEDLPEDLPEDLRADLAAQPADAPAAPPAAAEEIWTATLEDRLPEAAAPETPAADETEALLAAARHAADVMEKAERARARVIKIRRADALVPAEPKPAPAPTAVDGEPDVARLMRQTDDEMAVEENQRRLSAIQHLKAAVAATVADRMAGVSQPSDAERADPYRADLARVVRPVRPRLADATSESRPAAVRPPAAPGSDRPAPLVLVSEQRIDRPAGSGPVSPVRPRRVGGGSAMAAAAGAVAAVLRDEEQDDLHVRPETGALLLLDEVEDEPSEAEVAADSAFVDSHGFADFAERLGATDLPQLLEAAAAYATCVEKLEHFSRPLLMRRVAAGHSGEINREDVLRSFGTLLRDGRIEKVRRGQYALSEESVYLAEARKIAG